MSAQHTLGPSPEHFELMRGALDHIARTARKSRSMTRRLRWIEQRAEFAIRGEVYSSEKLNLPKSAGPDTPEKLQKRLSAITVQRDELLAALEGLTGDIQALIGESDGVAGLHMNGDVAPWGELEAGGRFERLTHLPTAHAAIAKVKGCAI